MITTNMLNSPELVGINIKGKLKQIYFEAGIPEKYHFGDINTSWSTEYSASQKLTGDAKKRSEVVKKIIGSYINNIDPILNRQGMKIKLKKANLVISDMILDGGKESGKTLLLSLVAQSAINRGYKAKFVVWPDFIDRFVTFDARDANEEFYLECCDVDLLIFDSVVDYEISNYKSLTVQLDRLISNRTRNGKVTLVSIDTTTNRNPVFGPIWNRFTRETFTLHLPGALNETNTKRA